MQFAPKEYHFGEDLGRQLGSGLSGALSSLAQFKLQDVMKRHQENQQRQAYEKIRPDLGWLANVPESVQKVYMQNLMNEHPDLMDIQQQGLQGTQNMMSGYQAQPETQMMDQLNQLYQQQQGPQNMAQATQGNVAPSPQTQQTPRATGWDRSPTGKRYTASQRFALERDERKAELKERQDLEKTYRPTITHMSQQYGGLIDQERSLDRMEQLIKKGKLPSPKLAAGLDFLANGATIYTPLGGVHLSGLNFKSAMGHNAEEFDKLSNDFIKNAKNIFGSRITDNDLRAFMSTVPNLLMTDKGKLRVIRNMRLYNEGIRARHDAMKSILSENDGRPPRNLELLIEERASNKLNDIARQFTAEPEKPAKSVTQHRKSQFKRMLKENPGIDLLKF